MNLLLTGASGFLGKALETRLVESGHRVVPLRRTPEETGHGPTWNPEAGKIRLENIGNVDAVVHLAGENIAQRWTPEVKARLRASRVEATRLLCESLAQQRQRPKVLICASATGYYGDRGDEILDEQSETGKGFLAGLGRDWEAAADPARDCGIRVAHLRFGMVLARHGGAMAKMLPAFRLGLGGRLGTGRQYWSWIGLEDTLGVIQWALLNENVSGAVNAVSPGAVRNEEFTKALARALRRPALIPMPALVVSLIFGEMGQEVLLASTRVRPKRLIESGYKFRAPDINSALAQIV